MARDYFTISDFYCTCCGNKGMPIPRKMSRQREEGHLKKMYCIHCKRDTNHLEFRGFENDFEEFKLKLKEAMDNYVEL